MRLWSRISFSRKSFRRCRSIALWANPGFPLKRPTLKRVSVPGELGLLEASILTWEELFGLAFDLSRVLAELTSFNA
jgi:hypothetical protein